jgi:hypothetical protein
VEIEVPNSELLDKYSILLIKAEKVINSNELSFVNNQIRIVKEKIPSNFLELKSFKNLVEINKEIWNLQDKLRLKVKHRYLNYFTIFSICWSLVMSNDERSRIKRKIDRETKSEFFESKNFELE